MSFLFPLRQKKPQPSSCWSSGVSLHKAFQAVSTPSARSGPSRAATATVAIPPSPAVHGPAGRMALTHTERSAFSHWSASSVGLLSASAIASQHAAAMGSSGVARPAARSASDPRVPDAMQVEPSSAAAVALSSASSSEQATTSSEAGPSGAQPGATTDAPMSDVGFPPRPQRKHSDAPVRKLSVSLIDTYKLINQVRSQIWSRGQPRGVRDDGSAPPGGGRVGGGDLRPARAPGTAGRRRRSARAQAGSRLIGPNHPATHPSITSLATDALLSAPLCAHPTLVYVAT